MLRAANSIADSKHADQPAAKSCSGLVPAPGLPGRDRLTSRRPSELRDIPERPPVVWAFAVYSTFSSRFISPSFIFTFCPCRPRLNAAPNSGAKIPWLSDGRVERGSADGGLVARALPTVDVKGLSGHE